MNIFHDNIISSPPPRSSKVQQRRRRGLGPEKNLNSRRTIPIITKTNQEVKGTELSPYCVFGSSSNLGIMVGKSSKKTPKEKKVESRLPWERKGINTAAAYGSRLCLLSPPPPQCRRSDGQTRIIMMNPDDAKNPPQGQFRSPTSLLLESDPTCYFAVESMKNPRSPQGQFVRLLPPSPPPSSSAHLINNIGDDDNSSRLSPQGQFVRFPQSPPPSFDTPPPPSHVSRFKNDDDAADSHYLETNDNVNILSPQGQFLQLSQSPFETLSQQQFHGEDDGGVNHTCLERRLIESKNHLLETQKELLNYSNSASPPQGLQYLRKSQQHSSQQTSSPLLDSIIRSLKTIEQQQPSPRSSFEEEEESPLNDGDSIHSTKDMDKLSPRGQFIRLLSHSPQSKTSSHIGGDPMSHPLNNNPELSKKESTSVHFETKRDNRFNRYPLELNHNNLGVTRHNKYKQD